MTAKKNLHESLRARYMSLVSDFLAKNGEEVLVTGSNEIALPCVDDEGNGEFLVLTFKVPTGSRDGEPYDGYSMAEDFALKTKAKEVKAAEAAKKKAAKIERDKRAREEKAKVKAAAAAQAKAILEGAGK